VLVIWCAGDLCAGDLVMVYLHGELWDWRDASFSTEWLEQQLDHGTTHTRARTRTHNYKTHKWEKMIYREYRVEPSMPRCRVESSVRRCGLIHSTSYISSRTKLCPEHSGAWADHWRGALLPLYQTWVSEHSGAWTDHWRGALLPLYQPWVSEHSEDFTPTVHPFLSHV